MVAVVKGNSSTGKAVGSVLSGTVTWMTGAPATGAVAPTVVDAVAVVRVSVPPVPKVQLIIFPEAPTGFKVTTILPVVVAVVPIGILVGAAVGVPPALFVQVTVCAPSVVPVTVYGKVTVVAPTTGGVVGVANETSAAVPTVTTASGPATSPVPTVALQVIILPATIPVRVRLMGVGLVLAILAPDE